MIMPYCGSSVWTASGTQNFEMVHRSLVKFRTLVIVCQLLGQVSCDILCCCRMLQSKTMTENYCSYLSFEQDRVQAHITENSVLTAEAVFIEDIISRRLWLLCSPGLNMCDFYLWGKWSEYSRSNAFILQP